MASPVISFCHSVLYKHDCYLSITNAIVPASFLLTGQFKNILDILMRKSTKVVMDSNSDWIESLHSIVFELCLYTPQTLLFSNKPPRS